MFIPRHGFKETYCIKLNVKSKEMIKLEEKDLTTKNALKSIYYVVNNHKLAKI